MSRVARLAQIAVTPLVLLAAPAASAQDGAPLSEATEACLMCHEGLHPGIVADWRNSRHARMTEAQALAVDGLERRVSAEGVPEDLIEVARKPYTCAQCHKGPDVPAYPVYRVSKHGNIQASSDHGWDYEAVPWKPGADFSAPTCATCHASLLANEDGIVFADRTHRMNDRLDTRLFGLPYAHAHPRSPATHSICNAAGLPLPVELTGGDSVFDDPLERLWVEQWLFYANSTRFASAMTGTDYGVFANGRFLLARNLREMAALLELTGDDQGPLPGRPRRGGRPPHPVEAWLQAKRTLPQGDGRFARLTLT